MKKLIILFAMLLLITACDDGDFDVLSFDFDSQSIQDCGELILFKINDNEALIIELNNDDVLTSETNTTSLNNVISYRIFSDNVTATYFCNEVPPSSPTINNEWNGSGTLNTTNIITRDDNDGIEELDLDLDTDGDDIPNYYDLDDDNDGIKTIDELLYDIDNNLIDTDTDGDLILNYLDDDDDGDNVLTINESYTLDTDDDTVVDYLDNDTMTVLATQNATLSNLYNLHYNASFTISNMSLQNSNGDEINYETYDYGTKIGDLSITN